MPKKRKRKSPADYQKVLDKLQGMQRDNAYWSPKEGKSTIRVLPPVGDMEYFVREVGKHRINNKDHFCLDVCTDGEQECPACEVNEMLYQAGEKEAAKEFYARRSYYMNIIVRGEEAAGPRIYTPGITVAGAVFTLIADPDYGEVYDVEDGTDIVIVRTGTGFQDTKYNVRPAKYPNTPLSEDDDEIDEWLDKARDLDEFVNDKLTSYEELAKATGANVYLDLDDDEDYEEEDEEDHDEYDDEEEDSVSDAISKRLARRKQAKGRSTSRRRAR